MLIPPPVRRYNNTRIISGRWYGPSHLSGLADSGGTLALSADTLYGTPIVVHEDSSWDRWALVVTTIGAAGKLLRFGLYNDQAGLPGSLILASGALPADVADTGASQTETIALQLAPGRYWWGVVSNGAPTVRAVAQAAQPALYLGGSTVDDTAIYRYVSRAFPYAAMPDPWGTVGSYVAGNPPGPRLRSV